MASLRRILALPMFLTALALLWVLGRQTGVDAMALVLGVTLIATLVLQWIGRRQVA
jgi:thiol:disulfide interchange protein